MTKQELISKIAERADSSQDDARRHLNEFLGLVEEELAKGNKLTLTGFGTFSVSERKARTGRNPRTGAEIKIPATKVPQFKAGKVLKEAVK